MEEHRFFTRKDIRGTIIWADLTDEEKLEIVKWMEDTGRLDELKTYIKIRKKLDDE